MTNTSRRKKLCPGCGVTAKKKGVYCRPCERKAKMGILGDPVAIRQPQNACVLDAAAEPPKVSWADRIVAFLQNRRIGFKVWHKPDRARIESKGRPFLCPIGTYASANGVRCKNGDVQRVTDVLGIPHAEAAVLIRAIDLPFGKIDEPAVFELRRRLLRDLCGVVVADTWEDELEFRRREAEFCRLLS